MCTRGGTRGWLKEQPLASGAQAGPGAMFIFQRKLVIFSCKTSNFQSFFFLHTSPRFHFSQVCKEEVLPPWETCPVLDKNCFLGKQFLLELICAESPAFAAGPHAWDCRPQGWSKDHHVHSRDVGLQGEVPPWHWGQRMGSPSTPGCPAKPGSSRAEQLEQLQDSHPPASRASRVSRGP